MKLIIFGMQKNLLLSKRNQGNTHVKQVIFIFFVHEEVKNLVNKRHLYVSKIEHLLLCEHGQYFLGDHHRQRDLVIVERLIDQWLMIFEKYLR